MFLLGVEPSPEGAEALAALRRQVPDAQVIETWDCCPTIELAVEFEQPGPLSEAGGPIIMARHRSEPYELLLFVTPNNRLRSIELVHYNDDVLTEFPPASDFNVPNLS